MHINRTNERFPTTLMMLIFLLFIEGIITERNWRLGRITSSNNSGRFVYLVCGSWASSNLIKRQSNIRIFSQPSLNASRTKNKWALDSSDQDDKDKINIWMQSIIFVACQTWCLIWPVHSIVNLSAEMKVKQIILYSKTKR